MASRLVRVFGPAAAAFLRTEPGAAAALGTAAARVEAARPPRAVAVDVRVRAGVSAGGLVVMTVLLKTDYSLG
ncbi:hypothetical protein GCM10022398_18870 [Acetobacter lovaniensis]